MTTSTISAQDQAILNLFMQGADRFQIAAHYAGSVSSETVARTLVSLLRPDCLDSFLMVPDATLRHAAGPTAAEHSVTALREAKSLEIVEKAEKVYKDNAAREMAKTRKAEEEFASLDLPDIELFSEATLDGDQNAWLIDGLQRDNSLIAVIAKKKTGKTAFSANWCKSLLTGEAFLDAYASVQPITGKVAYLNYEVDKAELFGTMSDIGVPMDRFLHIGLEGKANLLATEEGRKMLVRALVQNDVQALVIDPFSDASNGVVESQNDIAELNKFKRIINDIRSEAGIRATLLNVHAGHEGNHARGSSGLEDWPSALIYLGKKDGQVKMSVEGRRGVVQHRNMVTQYDGRTSKVTIAFTEAALDATYVRKGKREKAADARTEAAVAYVTANSGVSKTKAAKALSEGDTKVASYGTVLADIDKLIESGKFTLDESSKPAGLYVSTDYREIGD